MYIISFRYLKNVQASFTQQSFEWKTWNSFFSSTYFFTRNHLLVTTKHFTCIRVSFIRDIQLLFWFVRRLDNWVRRLFTEKSFLSETFRATSVSIEGRGAGFRRERVAKTSQIDFNDEGSETRHFFDNLPLSVVFLST